VRAFADSNWDIVGVGDFDGDAKDILWRNAATGENYIFLMNGTATVGEGYLRTVADLNWDIAGVGDFDGDARADILWRNTATGENYVYLMNGTAIVGEGYIATVAAWGVAGVGDFDGDGRSDILSRDASSGDNYMYLMDGLTIVHEGFIRSVADLDWRVAGIGDFDADGNSDILWRNSASGENYLFPMNSAATGEGAAMQVSVSFSDAGTNDTHSAVVDWGDGTVTPLASLPETAGAGAFVVSHAYADNGSYLVSVTLNDDDGGSSSDSFQATVFNVAPVVDAGAPRTANEGSLVQLTQGGGFAVTFSDAGSADTHTATIDWGDDSAVEAGVLDGNFVFGSHVYADNGAYSVTITVSDDDGDVGSDSFVVTVLNVAPEIQTSDQSGEEGALLSLQGITFLDAGINDAPYTATIDWGDGFSPLPAVIAKNSVTGSHVYADGVYRHRHRHRQGRRLGFRPVQGDRVQRCAGRRSRQRRDPRRERELQPERRRVHRRRRARHPYRRHRLGRRLRGRRHDRRPDRERHRPVARLRRRRRV
jgi:PKD repeat protein